jgi:hypothetical protein
MAIFGRRIIRYGCRKDSLNLVFSVLVASVLGGQALAAEGIVEINEARALAGSVTAGDTPGYPVTINEPDSYALTGNLSAGASTQALAIEASNVRLNLRGFRIQGSIEADSMAQRTHVLNGIVDTGVVSLRGESRVESLTMLDVQVTVLSDSLVRNNSLSNVNGKAIWAGKGSVVQNNRIDTAVTGMTVSNNSQISGNIIRDCVRDALEAGTNSRVVGNIIRNTGRYGLEAAHGTLVSGNTVSGATLLGYVFDSSTTFKDNVFRTNNGGIGNTQGFGGTEIGTNFCDTDTTCP